MDLAIANMRWEINREIDSSSITRLLDADAVVSEFLMYSLSVDMETIVF